MKNILFTIITISLFSFNAYAVKTFKSFDLIFMSPKGNHQYTLLKDLKNEKYILRFTENKKTQTKKLNIDQAQGLLQITTQITWSSKYRKPAHVKTCSAYAVLKSGDTKTTICNEDPENTGKTFGLLNQMRSLFK